MKMIKSKIAIIRKTLPLLPCIVLLCFFNFNVKGQTSDDAFRRPLKAVLEDIEKEFSITFKYSENLVQNKWLNYAGWRIKRNDLPKTLDNILLPFDLSYSKESERVFKIKKFDYTRRSIEEGQEHLDYLSGLYHDQVSWEARQNELRQCILEALDLHPLPEKPASKPIVSSKRTYDGYSVENVAIETLPGLYVCGSLYKPVKRKGSAPVVLNPNGHFGGGRYRADQQYRCASLARMGAYAFSYDLFAWGESLLQFKSEDHRQSIAHTIQVLNGMRILDFLLEQKGADKNKVGITGGSGGGSQTMVLAAIDERIRVSVPVVMVSSHMYGGCPCESGKPVHLCGGGTNNAEIAALVAPKPLLIISDGRDWTRTVPEIEFPFIQRIYGFYGKESLLKNVHLHEEGHDYGHSKRLAMYEFMAEHLGLETGRIRNRQGEVDEAFCTIEEPEKLYVFGSKGEKLPANAIKDISELMEVFEKVRNKKSQ